jgi:hypothetical protein
MAEDIGCDITTACERVPSDLTAEDDPRRHVGRDPGYPKRAEYSRCSRTARLCADRELSYWVVITWRTR